MLDVMSNLLATNNSQYICGCVKEKKLPAKRFQCNQRDSFSLNGLNRIQEYNTININDRSPTLTLGSTHVNHIDQVCLTAG